MELKKLGVNSLKMNERQCGNTTNKCIDACWSILRGESVLYITTTTNMQNHISVAIEDILLGGFGLEDISKYTERVHFMTRYNFDRPSFFAMYGGFVRRSDRPNKIIVDID